MNMLLQATTAQVDAIADELKSARNEVTSAN
jgi:hypothetical protein